MLAERLRGPRQRRLMFMTTMGVLSVTLAWLGWRLLQQDRQLEQQRLAERREAAADLAVTALGKRVSAIDQDLANRLIGAELTAVASPLADGAVIVAFRAGTFHVWPAGRLVYSPDVAAPLGAPSALFPRADELEFRQRDYASAIAALRLPAASTDLSFHSQALARIARNYLKSDQPQQALDAYEQVSALGAAPVGGMPAALAGRIGALAVYERQMDRAGLERTARALAQDLHSGRWVVTAATYDFITSEIARWIGDVRADARTRLALSEAVERFWHDRRSDATDVSGRTDVATSFGPVLLVWRSSTTALALFAAGAGYVEAQWLAPLPPGVSLVDQNGREVAGGQAVHGASAAVRVSSVTGLPWTVQVFDVGDTADVQALRARRQLFVAGLGVLLIVIVTGAWFVGASVARELDVARLQADFVSAVSHEFRTPLTTLCQLSELLERGRVSSDEEKQTYYAFLRAESDRLRRLVEGLLNFGRLQTGKVELRFETVDSAALVQQAAHDFTRAYGADGHRLVVDVACPMAPVQADREALRCALWNLLDNAVKYSPGCETVRIEVTKNGGHVEIAVRDEGIGIPRVEQRRIFNKFERGSTARERNISGTGIGLTTAREIVRAHAGDITVESEPGKGSTFRVRLPSSDPWRGGRSHPANEPQATPSAKESSG